MDWTINQIAGITGLPADTLRYYDREGIISPKRHENGYRHYNEADITILKYIIVMKYARFSLAEIKSMVELFGREPGADCTECNNVCNSILNSKIMELGQMISNYQKIVGLMKKLQPMVQNVEAYYINERNIEEFIDQIFDDIQSGDLVSSDISNNHPGHQATENIPGRQNGKGEQ